MADVSMMLWKVFKS